MTRLGGVHPPLNLYACREDSYLETSVHLYVHPVRHQAYIHPPPFREGVYAACMGSSEGSGKPHVL